MSRALSNFVRSSIKTVAPFIAPASQRRVHNMLWRISASQTQTSHLRSSPLLLLKTFQSCQILRHNSYAHKIVCPECSTEVVSSDSKYSFFCAECLTILPVDRSKNYFQVLNTPVTYDVDPRAVALFKRHLMKQLHPDKFAGSAPEQLRLAEDQSALVNEAASVLTNPYQRGVYLLKINGAEIEEGTNPELGQEFLMELMELNEEVDELSNSSDAEKMMKKIQRVVGSMERDLSEAFTGGCFASSTYTTFELSEAKTILEKIKFYLNMEDKIREKLTGL